MNACVGLTEAQISNVYCFLRADQDGDKKLTLSEFISLPVGTVENQQAQDIDDDWVRERKKEFEDVIDSDRDGIVTMAELEVRDEEGKSLKLKTQLTGVYDDCVTGSKNTVTPNKELQGNEMSTSQNKERVFLITLPL